MTNQLSFHTTTIKPFNNKNQVWITSSDLAKLLEYKNSDSVTKIYNRNSDEFTSKMTETVNLTASNNLKQTVRIFSLRGCHLIAMLAKTKVAKEVRKWLLDLADKEMGIIDTISVEQQQAIRQAVSQRAYRNGEHHQAVYHKLYAEFKIPRYQDLPASKFDDAIKFLGGIQINHIQFSDDELCTLAWCYKAGERMRKEIKLISDALYKLKSDFAPSFYSMGIEYTRTLENTRIIIERETRHIDPNQQGYLSNNWINVLPNIRIDKRLL